VGPDEPIEATQRQRAERRLLTSLRRHHRRVPLGTDVRVDTLIAELRAAEPKRPSRHRGAARLTLSDAQLREVVDGLVAAGTLVRRGHRVRLPDRAPRLDGQMQTRVAELLGTLREAGSTPPRAESVAGRLGIPLALVDQLRAVGELVNLAPGIDFPAATWGEISERLDRLGPAPSVRLVRDELATTRRHAEAILRRFRDTRGVE